MCVTVLGAQPITIVTFCACDNAPLLSVHHAVELTQSESGTAATRTTIALSSKQQRLLL
jgi:hypothetical protein